MLDGFVVLRYLLPIPLLVLLFLGGYRSLLGQSPVPFAVAALIIGGFGGLILAFEQSIRATLAELAAAAPSTRNNDDYWMGLVVGLSIGFLLWSTWKSDRAR